MVKNRKFNLNNLLVHLSNILESNQITHIFNTSTSLSLLLLNFLIKLLRLLSLSGLKRRTCLKRQLCQQHFSN